MIYRNTRILGEASTNKPNSQSNIRPQCYKTPESMYCGTGTLVMPRLTKFTQVPHYIPWRSDIVETTAYRHPSIRQLGQFKERGSQPKYPGGLRSNHAVPCPLLAAAKH